MVVGEWGGRVNHSSIARLTPSTFRFSFEDEIEEPLISFARVLIYDFEWSRAKKTGETPAATLDSKVGKVIEQIIASREADYTGDLEVSPYGSMRYHSADQSE